MILTDDQTQDEEAGFRVQQALDEANAVLSFLRAPYDEGFVRGSGGGGPWGGTTWPGGRRPPMGGSRIPGGVILGGGDPSHPAGTTGVAKDSGGDVMHVDDASAFQDTLERLRQRYALHFYWPEGSADPEQRTMIVSLAHSTGARFIGAEVRYRRAYLAKGLSRRTGGLTEVSREADPTDPEGTQPNGTTSSSTSTGNGSREAAQVQTPRRRRVAVNDSSGPIVNTVTIESTGPSDSQPATTAPSQATSTQTLPPAPVKRGGWPRVDEQKTQPSQTGPLDK